MNNELYELMRKRMRERTSEHVQNAQLVIIVTTPYPFDTEFKRAYRAIDSGIEWPLLDAQEWL